MAYRKPFEGTRADCGMHKPDPIKCFACARKSMMFCTRVKGHAGKHIACGTTTHRVHTWSSEQENE